MEIFKPAILACPSIIFPWSCFPLKNACLEGPLYLISYFKMFQVPSLFSPSHFTRLEQALCSAHWFASTPTGHVNSHVTRFTKAPQKHGQTVRLLASKWGGCWANLECLELVKKKSSRRHLWKIGEIQQMKTRNSSMWNQKKRHWNASHIEIQSHTPLRRPDIGVKLGTNVLKAWWTCVLPAKGAKGSHSISFTDLQNPWKTNHGWKPCFCLFRRL